ncbi:MAG: hypothetical protein ACI8RZ_001361 [Myxococcota bacterium]|jgi:hypothetical protein
MSFLQSSALEQTEQAPLMSIDTSLSEELEDPLMSVEPSVEGADTSTGSDGARSMLSRGYDETAQKEALENFGEVSQLDDGFAKTAGAVIDTLVPSVGSKGRMQLNVNVPVDATKTVTVGLEFIGDVERDAKGIKLRLQLGGGVRASKEIDAYIATIEAFAQAKVFGYMESHGSGGTQSFNQILLGIHHQISSVSTDIADALFSAQTIASTKGEMGDDDYVESGLGVDLSAGLSVDVGEDGMASGAGNVGASTGTKLSMKDGKLVEESSRTVTGGVKFIADPFTVVGALSGKWAGDGLDSVTALLTGDAMVDVEQLNMALIGGQWFSGVFDSLSDCITGGSGLLADGNAARKAGALAQFVNNNSGLGVAAEAGTAKALKSLSGFNGVKLGHRLNVQAKWSTSNGFGLDISMDRVSKIEFGDAPTDLVYVVLENIQELFKVSV